jgi:hypothetical protein
MKGQLYDLYNGVDDDWSLDYDAKKRVDHWYRFLKQRLHWTLPQLSTPQQSERWSDLMPILTWEFALLNCFLVGIHLAAKPSGVLASASIAPPWL